MHSRVSAYITLFLVAILSLLSCYYLSKLRFGYDFEAFFPNENKELTVYENFRHTFEYDNEFVLLGIENKAGIFRQDYLKKIDHLSTALKNIEHVVQVSSPTQIKKLLLNGLSPVEVPLLHYQDSTWYAADSSHIYSSEYVNGTFFSKSSPSVCIYIKTADRLSKTKSDSLCKRIERAYTAFNFDKVHIAGRIVAQQVYLQKIQHEFLLFMAISFLLVVIFLYITFRSVYGVIIPVSIVCLSILFTLGLMGFLNKTIDIMAVMLPTMIFIAGMSDVVHYYSKYTEELAKGTDKLKIGRLILKEVGFPTFLTLLTTVLGFLSLLFSSIKPIRDFGIFTSVGMVIAFLLSYSLLPALLRIFPLKKFQSENQSPNPTYTFMRRILFWVFRNPKTIISGTLIVLLLSCWGISRIKANHILLEDLRDDVPLKQAFNFFDQHYSGARPFELLVEVKDSSRQIWDYEILSQINRVDDYLKKNYELGFMLSPAIACKLLNQSMNGGESAGYVFPDKASYESELKKYLFQHKHKKELLKITDKTARMARISGKMKDLGSLAIHALNDSLVRFIKKNTRTDQLQFSITGAASLIDKNNEYMVSNMLQGFGWSLVVITLLTFLLHKSWRMVLVFLLPNIIPLLIIAGFMGFAGIELKASTSLIFSIAFGIATDDTIHFISRLKIELAYGKSLLYAFKRTYFETGKPILLTTFILSGGFMSLMLSDFQSTFLFGFLICITLLVALLAEFLLLPVLLLLIYKKNEKQFRSDQNG